MHIADRVILTLYTLLMAAASLVAIVFAAGLLPFDVAVEYLRLVPGRWEAAAISIAAVFFLVSVRLLLAGIGGGPKELVISSGEGGTAKISMPAVRKFVERAAGQVKGVHNVKARVASSGDLLRVRLTAGILPEANAPSTSAAVQGKVKDSVRDTIGREVTDVQVLFNTISYDNENK